MPYTARRAAALLFLVLCSTLLACHAREEARLGRLQRDLDRRLAELAERAQRLHENRVAWKELEARARNHCAPDDRQELLGRAGQGPVLQVSVREQRGRAVWLSVTGEGPSSAMVAVVEDLARQAPFFSLEEVSAKENHWALVLRSARPCPPPRILPAPPSAFAPPRSVLPPEHDPVFQSEEGQRLRRDIALAESRTRDILKVLGPAVNLRERVEDLRSTVEQAERDNDRSEDGVRRRLPLVHVLFDVPGAGPGSLRTLRRELVYEGGTPLEEAPWNTQLRAAGFRVARREGERRVLLPD